MTWNQFYMYEFLSSFKESIFGNQSLLIGTRLQVNLAVRTLALNFFCQQRGGSSAKVNPASGTADKLQGSVAALTDFVDS